MHFLEALRRSRSLQTIIDEIIFLTYLRFREYTTAKKILDKYKQAWDTSYYWPYTPSLYYWSHQSLFLTAVELNFEETAIDLLKLKPNLEESHFHDEEWTPLHWAVFNNNKTLVNALLDEGAQIDAKTGIAPESKLSWKQEGQTAYHLARDLKELEMAALLLLRGADSNIEPFQEIENDEEIDEELDALVRNLSMHSIRDISQDEIKYSRFERALNNVESKNLNVFFVGVVDKLVSLEKKYLNPDFPNKQDIVNQVMQVIQALELIDIKKYKRRLFVGEADFGYTEAFIKKHQKTHPNLAHNIIASEKLSEDELRETYKEKFVENRAFLEKSGVDCVYSLDFTKIEIPLSLDYHFSRIQFNFPHDKSDFNERTLPKLMRDFFQTAAKLQSVGDRFHMALPKPDNPKRRKFYQGYVYGIYKASAESGYLCIKKRKFGSERYPGYSHRITGKNDSAAVTEVAREYIFEKTNLSYDEIVKKHPPIKYKVYGKWFECLKEPDTSDGSSDYLETDYPEGCNLHSMLKLPHDIHTNNLSYENSYFWLESELKLYFVQKGKIEEVMLNDIDLFKSVLKGRSEENDASEKPKWYAILQEQVITFEESVVIGDGWCTLNAIGITNPQEALTNLQSQLDNSTIRHLLNCAIENNWYAHADQSLNESFTLNGRDGEGHDMFTKIQSLWQVLQNFPPEATNTPEQRRANNNFLSYLSRTDVLKAYLQGLQQTKYVNSNIADACLRLQGKKLAVFRNDHKNKANGQLSSPDAMSVSDINTVCLIFYPAETQWAAHYNTLKVLNIGPVSSFSPSIGEAQTTEFMADFSMKENKGANSSLSEVQKEQIQQLTAQEIETYITLNGGHSPLETKYAISEKLTLSSTISTSGESSVPPEEQQDKNQAVLVESQDSSVKTAPNSVFFNFTPSQSQRPNAELRNTYRK